MAQVPPNLPQELVRGECTRAAMHSHAPAPLTPQCHPIAFMDTGSSEWDEVELEPRELAVPAVQPMKTAQRGCVTTLRCFPATLSGCFMPRTKHSDPPNKGTWSGTRQITLVATASHRTAKGSIAAFHMPGHGQPKRKGPPWSR